MKKLPPSDVTRLVVAFVAVLTTFTETPGTPAFVESSTTPVMLPRSDCPKHTIGFVIITAVSTRRIESKRLLVICLPSKTVHGQSSGNPDRRRTLANLAGV